MQKIFNLFCNTLLIKTINLDNQIQPHEKRGVHQLGEGRCDYSNG